MELCVGIWKKWAQCPEELGPPTLLGKNKIINSENEAVVEKHLTNRNTLKAEETQTQKFSRKKSADGAHEPKRALPKGKFDSDVILVCTLCLWLSQDSKRIVRLGKNWLVIGLEKSKLNLFFHDFLLLSDT